MTALKAGNCFQVGQPLFTPSSREGLAVLRSPGAAARDSQEWLSHRLTSSRSGSQFSEKIPQVSHEQFRLLPAGKMPAARHLRVLHQIEISLEDALRRVQSRQLARK